MTQGNGGSQRQVLAEIEQRLAAIAPERYIAPHAKKEEGAHPVCFANDHLKALYTLMVLLWKQTQELSAQGMGMAADFMKETAKMNPAEIAEAFGNPNSVLMQKRERVEECGGRVSESKNFAQIVLDIFWLEVRRQHRDLLTKRELAIYSDWSLCWKTPENGEDSIVRVIAMKSPEDVTSMFQPGDKLH
jgi:hypothetical protein